MSKGLTPTEPKCRTRFIVAIQQHAPLSAEFYRRERVTIMVSGQQEEIAAPQRLSSPYTLFRPLTRDALRDTHLQSSPVMSRWDALIQPETQDTG